MNSDAKKSAKNDIKVDMDKWYGPNWLEYRNEIHKQQMDANEQVQAQIKRLAEIDEQAKRLAEERVALLAKINQMTQLCWSCIGDPQNRKYTPIGLTRTQCNECCKLGRRY